MKHEGWKWFAFTSYIERELTKERLTYTNNAKGHTQIFCANIILCLIRLKNNLCIKILKELAFRLYFKHSHLWLAWLFTCVLHKREL